MSDPELHKLLQLLQTQIENTPSVDEPEQELLRGLHTDIHKLLERSSHEPEQSPISALKGLRQNIEAMEVSHPTLTTTISQLLEILSNAGI